MLSTTVEPLIDRFTYNPNAPMATKEDYWNTFIDTALSTVLLMGVGKGIDTVTEYRDKAISKVNESNMSAEQKQQSISEIEKGANELIDKVKNNAQNSTNINENTPNIEQISQNNVQNVSDLEKSQQMSISDKQNRQATVTDEIQTFIENRNKTAPGLNVEMDNTLQTDGIIIKNSDGTRTMKINPNSTRAYEFVAVHEMLHDLEGTQEYSELQKYVQDRAVSHEDYKQAKQKITEQYANFYKNNNLDMSNLDMNVETVNDMVAQALGNQQFLNELAGNKPNVFMKMYNWVKNVLFDGQNTGKTFNERRTDNKYLQELKKKFESAYNTAYNGNASQQYSIQTDTNGNKYVKVDTDQDIFDGKTLKEQKEIAREYILEKFREKGIMKDNQNINITRKTAKEYAYPKNILNKEMASNKMRASTELDNILNISKYKYGKQDDGRHSFAKKGWEYYETVFQVGNKTYTGLLNIANDGNKRMLYDITNIKETSSNNSIKTASSANSSLSYSIPSSDSTVNNQYMQNEKYNATQQPKTYKDIEEIESDISDNIDKATLIAGKNSNTRQKKRKMVSEYLENKYPNNEITFQINYDNGNVRVVGIYDKQSLKELKEQNEKTLKKEAEEYRRKHPETTEDDELELTYNEYPNEKQLEDIFDINNRIDELVQDLNRKGYDISVEHSKASADASYIDIETNEGVKQIRVANHYKSGVSGGNADVDINMNEYGSKNVLIEDIKKAISDMQNSEKNSQGLEDSSQSFFSNQGNTEWSKYLKENWDLMPNSKKTFGFPTNEQLQAMDNKKISESADALNLKEVNQNFNAESKSTNLDKSTSKSYKDIKLNETKNIPTNDILELLKDEGGYRKQEYVSELKESIKKDGIKTPIEISISSDGQYQIDNGKHRLQIAKELGIDKVPVKLVESWSDIVSRKVNKGAEENDGATNNNNVLNEESRSSSRMSRNSNEILEDGGTATRNVELFDGKSDSIKQRSSIQTSGNNIENSEKSSFLMPTNVNNISLNDEMFDFYQQVSTNSNYSTTFKQRIGEMLEKTKSRAQFEKIKETVANYKTNLAPIEIDKRANEVRKYIDEQNSIISTQGLKMKNSDIVDTIVDNVGMSKKHNYRTLNKVASEINDLLYKGELTDTKIEEIVNNLGENIQTSIDEYYEANKELKKTIQNTQVYVSDKVKKGFNDWNDFRKRAMGSIKITNNSKALPVDTFYTELSNTYGEDMFPSNISNASDQLQRIIEVAKQIKETDTNFADYVEKTLGTNAWNEVSKQLVETIKGMRTELGKNSTYVAIPESKGGIRERNWTKTAKENDLVKNFLDVKDLKYQIQTNSSTIKKANAILDSVGYETAYNNITSKIKTGEMMTAKDIALGERLIQEYIKNGEYEKATDLIYDVTIIGTELGQAVQAMRLIKRLSPQGQLAYLQRAVERINNYIISECNVI